MSPSALDSGSISNKEEDQQQLSRTFKQGDDTLEMPSSMTPPSPALGRTSDKEEDLQQLSRTFTYQDNELSWSEEDPNGFSNTKGRRSKKQWSLPQWLKIHLSRYMYHNNYFHANNFACPREPLNRFYELYSLRDSTKDGRAKDVLEAAIVDLATEITWTVRSQNGFYGEHVDEGSKNYHILNASYTRGYEYIDEDGWDGKMNKKFFEISEFKEKISYGSDRNIYTMEEINEMQGLFAEMKKKVEALATADPSVTEISSNAKSSGIGSSSSTRPHSQDIPDRSTSSFDAVHSQRSYQNTPKASPLVMVFDNINTDLEQSANETAEKRYASSSPERIPNGIKRTKSVR